jgi:hypothetical protein
LADCKAGNPETGEAYKKAVERSSALRQFAREADNKTEPPDNLMKYSSKFAKIN